MIHLLPLVRLGRNFLGLLMLWLLAATTHAQTLSWQAAVAAAGDVQVQASSPDGTGNVYLAGGFAGTATFGNTTLTTTNPQEVFVAKWNSSNGFVWAIKGTGSTTAGRNTATAIVAYTTTAVYVAGNFVSSTLALGSTTLTNAQAGNSDIFVARLSTVSGSVSFAKRAGGTANDYATAISSYFTTYVYVGGSSGGNAAFDNYTLVPAGGFIARYPGAGTAAGPTSPAPVVAAGDGVTALSQAGVSLYAAGTFSSGAATVGGSVLTSNGGEDLFVSKLSYSDLNTSVWTRQTGGSGNDYARSLLVTGGTVYVGGSYQSPNISFGATSLTNTGAANLFVSKITDSGTTSAFSWAVQNGGTSSILNANTANALALYGNSLYVAGAFGGTATFGSTSLTSAGSTDVLTAKIADAGSSASFVAAQQAGGTGADFASGLGRLDARTLYTTGQVTTPATFGSISLGTGAGVRPGFVATLADQAPFLTLVAPSAAMAGTTVTLYGQGLIGTTAVTFAGTSNNVVTSGFTVNAAGTQISGVVVPAGAQSGTVNATTALGSSNGLAVFTVLTAPNSAPVWQRVLTADNSSFVRWAAQAPGGNVIVAGEFFGTITLGGTTLTSVGGKDIFVAKLNPATGSYAWAVRAGGSADDDVYGNVAVNGSNIYLAGQLNGPSITLGNVTLTPQFGGLSGYVAKLIDAGSSASFVWGQLLDDGGGVFVEALTVSGNSVYVGGDYTGDNLAIGTGTVGPNQSFDDGYLAKFVDNGSTATFAWARGIGNANGVSTTNSINVYGICVNGSTVYITGVFFGVLDFDSYRVSSVNGSGDIAVARLTDNGTSATFTSALQLGGTGSEFASYMSRQGNSLYISGLNGSATWPGTTVTGTGAGFVAKVTDFGSTLGVNWVQFLNRPVYQTAVNGTGVYAATLLIGTDTYAGTPLQSSGSSDALVVRLQDGGNAVSVAWAQTAGGLNADSFHALALANGRVVVGGSVVPAAAFGSIVVTAPDGLAVAAIGVLADATLLATTSAQNRAPLAISPNPAHGQATVHALAGAETLRLFDMLGREVRHYAVPAGTTEAPLDLRGLPVGLYVVRSAVGSRQLVVE